MQLDERRLGIVMSRIRKSCASSRSVMALKCNKYRNAQTVNSFIDLLRTVLSSGWKISILKTTKGF